MRVYTEAEKARIQEIQKNLRVLSQQAYDLMCELDKFREKCPTCQCRLLPDAECSCCASLPSAARGDA